RVGDTWPRLPHRRRAGLVEHVRGRSTPARLRFRLARLANVPLRRTNEAGLFGQGLLGRADLFFCGDLGTDLLERAPDQTRHVHLRDADLLRDLRLRQSVEEAQLEDLPLALVERLETRREDRAVLRHLVLMLLGADRLERVEILVPVAADTTRRERERRVCAPRLERLEHVFLL